MGKWHRIYVLIHDGVYRDAFLSYSEAVREKHPGGCCTIMDIWREDY